MNREIVRKAIALAGGQVAVADALGIKQPSVSAWVKAGRVSHKRYRALSRLTGGVINPAQLRPDLEG